MAPDKCHDAHLFVRDAVPRPVPVCDGLGYLVHMVAQQVKIGGSMRREVRLCGSAAYRPFLPGTCLLRVRTNCHQRRYRHRTESSRAYVSVVAHVPIYRHFLVKWMGLIPDLQYVIVMLGMRQKGKFSVGTFHLDDTLHLLGTVPNRHIATSSSWRAGWYERLCEMRSSASNVRKKKWLYRPKETSLHTASHLWACSTLQSMTRPDATLEKSS